MPKAEDNEARLSKEKVRAIVDQQRAWVMRAHHFSDYAQIGRALGCTATAARLACERQARRLKPADADQLRAEFTASIDNLAQREMRAIQQCEEVLAFRDSNGNAHPQAMEAHARLASHVRTVKQLIGEKAMMNGLHVAKVELTGAHGGPIRVTRDDILGALQAADDNVLAVEAEGVSVGETEH
jgi:hypothetical protein